MRDLVLNPLTLDKFQIYVVALCLSLLSAFYIFYTPDPYNLKRIPTLRRSRILDAYRTGAYWRIFLPRLLPYLDEAYYEHSKNGRPFKVWIAGFQAWMYVLPPRYLGQIKNQGLSELSLRDVIDTYVAPRFSTGPFDTMQVQVASKLINRHLGGIKPLVQICTEEILAEEIGNPTEWKRFHAHTIATKIVKYVSGRMAFGESLANNPLFLDDMQRFVSKISHYGLIMRWIKIPILKDAARYLLNIRHRQDLAVATRYVTQEIEKRHEMQKRVRDYEKPVDCIQWAMDNDIPAEFKTPEQIAHRLFHLGAGLIESPILVLLNLLYDAISHGECLEEIRTEISQCLAEADGAWTEVAIGKMAKLDSFMHESTRLTPGLSPVVGSRLVTCEAFRFDENLVFPKGTLVCFPLMPMQKDPDIFPEPHRFDGLRFHKMRDEESKTGIEPYIAELRTGWLTFGYGRQACPGRFYAIGLLKTILGEMLLRYDIRYAGGERPRPEPFDLEPSVLANTTVDLEFRCRK